jgi:hypothetical protein
VTMPKEMPSCLLLLTRPFTVNGFAGDASA